MFLDVLAVLLKLKWQAIRKQQDSDGNCTTLPKAGSTEHLYDMETAGQMFSTTDTWLEMPHVLERALGGAMEI